MSSYKNLSLIDVDKRLSNIPKKVVIDGNSLEINEAVAVGRSLTDVELTKDKNILSRIKLCYEKMIENIKEGIPIYGCNTGYGGQAGHVLVEGTAEERLKMAKKISEGIAHIDVSVGPEFTSDIVRTAMLIRINTLMKGVSAIKLSDLEIYRDLLNKNLTPVVNQYGGIGASGDLAHNARILSAVRQMKSAEVVDSKGKRYKANYVLKKHNIRKLNLDPKAGLGFVNGDNFSSSLALFLAKDTIELLLESMVLGAMVVEMLKGTDRSFHPLLASVRPHKGQKEVADIFRFLLKNSKYSYQEMKGQKERPKGVKVQDGYSLRCISQYHGVNVDKLYWSLDTIATNINSVSDNPLWVTPEEAVKGETPWQWVSGGNFIASYMVEVMDGLRKTMTQITKINDRHISRLINSHESNGLPPNLSDKAAITQCAFKGVQIQSGMFDVYSSLLSIPVSTFFGIHEESNQDITSHALTSGILGLENLRVARYSTAQNLIAVCQAVDLREGKNGLSPRTKPVYDFIRELSPYVTKERPLHGDIERVYESIRNGEMMKMVRNKVLSEYTG